MRFRILPIVLALAALVLALKTGEIMDAFAQGAPAAPAPAAGAPPLAKQAADEPLLPLGLSVEELELLQSLAHRRAALDEREQTLLTREGRIEAAEKRITAKLSELDTLKRDIDGLIRKYDSQEEKELASLVKIYETMKPKDAARILDQVEFPVLVTLMERIKERSTAPILSAMNEQVARRLTSELARRRDLKPPG